jgi:hypothetical protein
VLGLANDWWRAAPPFRLGDGAIDCIDGEPTPGFGTLSWRFDTMPADGAYRIEVYDDGELTRPLDRFEVPGRVRTFAPPPARSDSWPATIAFRVIALDGKGMPFAEGSARARRP